MNKLVCFCACGLMLSTVLVADQVPSAKVELRITSELPIVPEGFCSGCFTVTNNGSVPFVIVVDSDNIDGAVHLYRNYDVDRQRLEDEHWGGAQRNNDERQWVTSMYEQCLGTGKMSARLNPGASTNIYCKKLFFAGKGDVYKAEMYLGNGAWTPVSISPPVGYVVQVGPEKVESENTFFYSKEGTNQYLYLKLKGRFHRVSEMKVGTTAKEEADAVEFDSSDGVRKRLTRDAAKKRINDWERNGGHNEQN